MLLIFLKSIKICDYSIRSIYSNYSKNDWHIIQCLQPAPEQTALDISSEHLIDARACSYSAIILMLSQNPQTNTEAL